MHSYSQTYRSRVYRAEGHFSMRGKSKTFLLHVITIWFVVLSGRLMALMQCKYLSIQFQISPFLGMSSSITMNIFLYCITDDRKMLQFTGRPLHLETQVPNNGSTNYSRSTNYSAINASLQESRLRLVFCTIKGICVTSKCYCCANTRKCYVLLDECKANCPVMQPHCKRGRKVEGSMQ